MMSGKRRHVERMAKTRAREQQVKLDVLARGVDVDWSALTPNGSYSQPDFVERGYYVDKPFVCRGCGLSETWSAEQQKWWYEVAKGSLYSTASYCRPCRQSKRAQREEARLTAAELNPYKSSRFLFAKVCSNIEPSLRLAGYRPVGRNRRVARGALFRDYMRSDDLFALSWNRHQARLAAELLAGGGADIQVIATAEFSGLRSTSDFEARLTEFIARVRTFLDGLVQSPPEP